MRPMEKALAVETTPGRTRWWTDEEDRYLTKNYRDVCAAEIAHHLGRSRNAVIGRANRLGLSVCKYETARRKAERTRAHHKMVTRQQMKYTEEIDQKLLSLYFDQGLNRYEVAVEMNMTPRPVAGRIQRIAKGRVKVVKPRGPQRGMGRRRDRNKQGRPKVASTVAVAPTRLPPPRPVPATAKPLLEAGYADCRAPVGEAEGADMLICGAKITTPSVYLLCDGCREHLLEW